MMERHPMAKGSENAHILPETYPTVKFPNKVSPHMAKRKERPATMDLRVHVLQEQAKRPRLCSGAAVPQPTGKSAGKGQEGSAPRRSPFRETTNHNNRPSAFTDLESLNASSNGLSSCGGNVFARPPPAQPPRSKITTFSDIATVRPALPTDNDILDAMTQDILQMRSVLPPGDSRSRDALSRQQSSAKGQLSSQQQPQQAARSTQLLECPRPPLDWSLKKRALFHSQQPFCVARDAIMAPSAAAHEAVASFASGSRPTANADGDAGALQRALMTWQHPDAPLPAPAVAALRGAGAAGQGVLDARRGAWQEAFRSLFLALRAGRCAAFYLVAAQGCKRPYVAYFGGTGSGGHQRLHAWLSRSTHGLRERLRAEPHALRFAMPLAPQAQLHPCMSCMRTWHSCLRTAAAAEADVRDERMQAELREIGLRKAPSAAAGVDGRPASLLVFEGRAQAHGLFEWLLSEVTNGGEGADVPLLLAPVPFLGASIQALQPRLLPSVDAAAQQQGARGKPTGSQQGAREPPGSCWRGGHRLELAGLLPPWVLNRVCAVLARSQGGQFQASLETDPLTTTFNLVPTVPEAEKAVPPHNNACMEGGAIRADEAEQWSAPAGPMALRVMRELSCAKNLYTARLDA